MEHPNGGRGHAEDRSCETRGCGPRRVHGSPIARSRLVVAEARDTFDYWEIPDDLIRVPIPIVDCPDDATLARLRTDFYSPPFPIHEAPQFRVQVARRLEEAAAPEEFS